MILRLSKEELILFLKNLQIKDAGIQAILKTFLTEPQYWKFKWAVERKISSGKTPKKAIKSAWITVRCAQMHMGFKVGPEPTKEDIEML